MEYHYIVVWSEEKSWHIDWEQTLAKYHGQTIYVPNLDIWTMPVKDSETSQQDDLLVKELNLMLSKEK